MRQPGAKTMASHPKNLLTPEDYLAFDRQCEYKNEYFAGEVFAMTGASREHNLIVTNTIRTLGNQLLTRDCNVYPSDLRVKIQPIEKYTYPDVVMTCGEEQFEDEYRDTLLNPVVIIEVLSASTEAYDRGKKFARYQQIDSLVEYILIAQDHHRIERYVRQPDRTWVYSEFRALDDVVQLTSIGCHLALQDVYAKLNLRLSKEDQ
jgi:Uma2 family endonuclease